MHHGNTQDSDKNLSTNRSRANAANTATRTLTSSKAEEEAEEKLDGKSKDKEAMQSDLAPERWGSRMSKVVQNCNFSGKERKTCQKCLRVYPFFKTECNYCQYKFPKTRLGASTSIQTDSYTLQFWSKLRQDIGIFDSLTQLNEYLEDTDLMSVRDLYKKIKEVLS